MDKEKITTTLSVKCLRQIRALMTIYETDNKNVVIENAINEIYNNNKDNIIKEVNNVE